MTDTITPEQALKNLIRGYVNLLETGRDRIIAASGDCDPVDKMEASDSYLREARAVLGQQADQGWQPIETAPKSNPIKPEHRLIFWLDGIGPAFGYAYDDGAGGLLTVIDGYSGGRWEPTHWKPMLAAPKVVK